jgi:hypothetical protein
MIKNAQNQSADRVGAFLIIEVGRVAGLVAGLGAGLAGVAGGRG